MANIIERQVPSDALTQPLLNDGAFVDCYCIEIECEVSLSQYIFAFYTSPLFKVERALLSLITLKRTKDCEAVALSLGKTDRYSIWQVENRTADQLLLADFTGNTMSWFQVEPLFVNHSSRTRLYFGSVVMPRKVDENGKPKFGLIFHLLLKFHSLYSRALLKAAYKKVV